MRSEADAAIIDRYRSELSYARDALRNAYRQLAALRTERKMQEARQKQIAWWRRNAESLRDELAKRANAQDVEAWRKRILDMDRIIENWRDAYNVDMGKADDQIRRLTAERDEARAQAGAAGIELNQLRQEVTTLRGERSRLVTERDEARTRSDIAAASAFKFGFRRTRTALSHLARRAARRARRGGAR